MFNQLELVKTHFLLTPKAKSGLEGVHLLESFCLLRSYDENFINVCHVSHGLSVFVDTLRADSNQPFFSVNLYPN